MSTIAAPRHPTRSTELTTGIETVQAFVRMGSPRVLMIAIVLTAALRLAAGHRTLQSMSSALVLVAVIVALTGPVEWAIHRFLLHCPVDSFRFTKIGTGVSHRQHHLDPPDLNHLVLYAHHAAIFVLLLSGISAAWSALLAGAFGWPRWPSILTAIVAAQLSLLHYEWTHLISHTTYRPRFRYYATKARHHRLHHYRNERYWLGVTSNTGDRLLGSLPGSKGDVPLSPTARTLDR
ncbi:MAG: sterol desaturase family protein [Acidimicrobiales bacterium]|nr:sterol desaturase family protein [Acidimicrobiales bacterium]